MISILMYGLGVWVGWIFLKKVFTKKEEPKQLQNEVEVTKSGVRVVSFNKELVRRGLKDARRSEHSDTFESDEDDPTIL